VKSPPYHLRTNKAVDRYMLVEVLKRVLPAQPAKHKFRYVGMGGPFLEDLKIIDQYFPEMPLVSIEEEPEVVKRQEFHRFKRGVELRPQTDKEFVAAMDEGTLVALWFDYLGCEAKNFERFGDAVKKAAPGSILRITLNAGFRGEAAAQAKFKEDFDQILPANWEPYFENEDTYLVLLQKMIEMVTLPPPMSEWGFYLINSSTYRDGARMLTVTGIKCLDAEWPAKKRLFVGWPFRVRNWDHRPIRINVPELSLQERMRLSAVLPTTSKSPGKRLRRRLGYLTANSEKAAADDLANYAAFVRYFPVFARLAG
jgi:hypothetical protein